MLTKDQVVTVLYTWINQRPGLEFANYGDVSSYRSELRSITRDRADALQLLRAVELRDSITADDLIAAFPRAYSGRLSISEGVNKKGEPCAVLDYCAGQYFPTEYRKAACAVLASVLWDRARADMPAPDGKAMRHGYETETYQGKSAGDWLRSYFRRQFGRGIASRWFN